MILKFPNLDTLRLALLSGAVPSSVSLTPASAGYDEQEALWVETAAALPRAAQNELKKLGVLIARTNGSTATADITCWPELLPLLADKGPIDRPEQTPVLFDLSSGEELSRFVMEILRLGNDRQSYRWLDPSPQTPLPSEERGRGEGPRTLLRVVGPPYYTLLRALNRNGDQTAPRAFLERAPRVWIELGWTHPLADHLKPADGKLLLLQPPCRWTPLDEAPFHDIYEVLEFPLPNVPSRYREGTLDGKMKVTPSLKTGGSPDGAEFWVLGGEALAELNYFVQNANDQLLHRLAFAVGEQDGKHTVVLRVRQSKLPPPVLTLNAVGYRPFQRLPNLFLPVGKNLHPPLRRDIVRKMLADDPSIVTWLSPHEGGSFTPCSLPEDSFRPLMDWIDYVLDRDRQALQAWVQAAQFEFEPFICDEDHKDKPKKPLSDKARNAKKARENGDNEIGNAVLFEYVDKSRKPDEKTPNLDPFSAIPQATPSELEQRRRELEEQFLSIPGGLDAPERQPLWPELAGLNTALNNTEDAGICWINALWNRERVPASWKGNWFRAEAKAVPYRKEPGFPRGRSWVTQIMLAPEKRDEVGVEDLDRVLALEEPASADVRSLTAYVVWMSGQSPAPAALLARLQPVQHFLEKHETLLPVRAAWLAWLHLMYLSRGDVLALARTRDRLLERLFHNGLRPELDMPSFLRFAGQPSGTRFRGVRDWLVKMCDLARKWTQIAENRGTESNQTKAYIDLLFAFGLARLGEHDACRDILQRAKEALDGTGEAHGFLLQAFDYRIKQALDGRPSNGSLPPEHMEYLEQMERMQRYVVERLRERSRILEPDTKLDPYRHWATRLSDLDKALAELVDLFDRKEVTERVAKLFKELPKSASGHEDRARVLQRSLEIAPRVSEDFARDLLEKVATVFDALPKPLDITSFLGRAKLLERALFVAAHFDRLEHIQPFLSRFRALLESQDSERAVSAIDELAGHCLRGLRKLGMQDEIDSLLKLMANLILGGKDWNALAAKPESIKPAELRALLHVAGGWYYFNRDAQAEPIMQAARSQLMQKQADSKEKTNLAAVYATTLGQAPREVAQKRLEELFTQVGGIKDTFTTARYYYRSQLDVVEAVVLAVVSDDFTMGSQARRWLDDDEFLVRRRIHRDLKAVMAHT
jgi:cellulose synthase operon protein C